MSLTFPGMHHVTSIGDAPQRNIDFYTGVLGLRLLKLTVNFDMPNTYHLYYGDRAGTLGTILTIFPWPGARRGRSGAGQIDTTSFLVPGDSLGYWADRLRTQGIVTSGPVHRFDDAVLTFEDPDGLVYELVARAGAQATDPWIEGGVPGEHAIVGFAAVTLRSRRPDATAALLTELLGFVEGGEEAGLRRFSSGAGSAALGSTLYVAVDPGDVDASEGTGTVHHVAWRTRDDEEQQQWRRHLLDNGLNVTEMRDRSYFHSIYFREPGGILFEIATDPPGFTYDEAVDALGSALKLPPWAEPRRASIERGLRPIRLPSGTRVP